MTISAISTTICRTPTPPATLGDAVVVTTRHVLPNETDTYFPKNPKGFDPLEDKNYLRVLEKGPRVAHNYLKGGYSSAFDSRFETRGNFEDDWEGAFVIRADDLTFIVILSGLTGKLSEAVLLTACVDLGILSEEEAVAYSRPMKPGRLNKPRRNFDYFYSPVSRAWREHCAARDQAMIDQLEA